VFDRPVRGRTSLTWPSWPPGWPPIASSGMLAGLPGRQPTRFVSRPSTFVLSLPLLVVSDRHGPPSARCSSKRLPRRPAAARPQLVIGIIALFTWP
jgi:hypothetical protein